MSCVNSNINPVNTEMPPIGASQRGRVSAILSVLALIIFIAFLPCLDNGFVNWDDDVYFLENPLVKHLSWDSVRTLFFSYDRFVYTPVTFLFFAVQHHFFGVDPLGYHTVSLILHICNAWLIFWLFFLIRRDLWVAFGVALLFGIHPLRVESVAWVTEQKDLLYTFFILGAFISYIYHRRFSGRFLYYASLVLFFVSLAVKPMMMLFPFLLVCWELIYNRQERKDIYIDKLPFFVLSLMIAIVNGLGFFLEGQMSGLVASWQSVFFRLYFYLSKMIWPVSLSCLYPNTGHSFFKFEVLIAPALVFAAFLLGFFCSKERRSFFFGALFFLLILFPLLMPTRYFIVADHYVYLAAAGVFLWAAEVLKRLYLDRCSGQSLLRVFFAVCAAVVVFLMAQQTWRQAHVWRDGLSLWKHAAALFPEDAKIRNSLGNTYFNKGDYPAALREASHFWRMAPIANAAVQMGCAYFGLKDFEKARVFFGIAIRLNPGCTEAYNEMGLTYSRNQDASSQEEAVRWFKKAIQTAAFFRNPAGLRSVYQNLGQAYLVLGLTDAALATLRKAVLLNPDSAASQLLYLQALVKNKDYGQALEVLERLIILTPDDPTCYRMAACFVGAAGMAKEAAAFNKRAEELEKRR
jgi:tetratricopeptide (TPR) repeat protein